MINIVQILPIGFRVDEDGKELTTERTFKNALSFVLGYLLQPHHQSESQTLTLTITKNSSTLWDEICANVDALDRGAHFQ